MTRSSVEVCITIITFPSAVSFFLDRALHAIAFCVLDIGVIYLWALGLIPKH